MSAGIARDVFVALVLALVPSLLGFAAFLSPSGLSPLHLVALYVEMAGLGLLALAVIVYWRLYTAARRPSWPFIFFASGTINTIVWAVLTAIGSMGPQQATQEGYIDVSQSYAVIALVVAAVWAIAGLVFGWLKGRSSVNGTPQ